MQNEARCERCQAEGVKLFSVRRLRLTLVCTPCGREAIAANPVTDADRKRMKRNSACRERYAALRSLGLVKTPYGWE